MQSIEEDDPDEVNVVGTHGNRKFKSKLARIYRNDSLELGFRILGFCEIDGEGEGESFFSCATQLWRKHEDWIEAGVVG